MSRLLYEKSVSHQGNLIIPFIIWIVEKQEIYSYVLLSELGNKGKFNKAENPAKIYSGTIEGIIKIAKEHLDSDSEVVIRKDYFKSRYTYHDHLIVIYQEAGQFFYDHYPPFQLTNIAAPKLFNSEQECINWIRQEVERSHPGQHTNYLW